MAQQIIYAAYVLLNHVNMYVFTMNYDFRLAVICNYFIPTRIIYSIKAWWLAGWLMFRIYKSVCVSVCLFEIRYVNKVSAFFPGCCCCSIRSKAKIK